MRERTRLSVNLNKVALLRNTRDLDLPNVVRFAHVAVEAGADGITVHPRPDERHIRKRDVYDLAQELSVELNVEGNPFDDWLSIVRDVKPTQATLVPDSVDARTSDHGWELIANGEMTEDAYRVRDVLADLRDRGIRTSLFMEPDREQIDAAKALGADRIELYTEPYASAFGKEREDDVWESFRAAAVHATSIGLGVNAGHDLNLQNLPRFLEIPDVLEVSIGHALTADALERGFAAAVRAYREITDRSATSVGSSA